MTRKIIVPGVPLEINNIITDEEKSAVFSIAHNDQIIVVFFSAKHSPSARLMTIQQAKQFSDDLMKAHQAIKDDIAIQRMEKEFDE